MYTEANADLTHLNTFAFPCEAKVLYRIDEDKDLPLLRLELRNAPCLILGGGSNLLLPEKLDCAVARINIKGKKLVDENEQRCLLEVAAGENWHEFVLWTVSQGLWGIENLALIPGSVGAAPVQNIGAYGVELKNVIDWVEFYHLKTGEFIRLTPGECQFSYRQSIFKSELKDVAVITRVGLRLTRKPNPQLNYGPLQSFQHEEPITPAFIADKVAEIRQSKLPNPDVLGNAGSFFKNPLISDEHYRVIKQAFPDVVAYPQQKQWKLAAGWLIEKAKFRGMRRGAVGVHKDQALVLVHFGHGKADELLKLAKDIQQTIQSTFGVLLEMEVRTYPFCK